MNQAELARRIGIKQPSLHDIESGKTKTLKASTLAGLCSVLNVHQDAILKGGAKPDESMLLESELIAIWRALDSENQDHLLAIGRALSAKPQRAPMRPRADDLPSPPPHKVGSAN